MNKNIALHAGCKPLSFIGYAELKGSVESKEISFYGMNKKMGEECDSDWKKNYICKIFLKMRKE